MDSINRALESKGKIRIKFALTEEGQNEIITGNGIKVLGDFMNEFQRSKEFYLDNGYTIIEEDKKDWILILEK
ncbi:hypothetical protein [Aquimarina litoralis]|uniref:hypothetical protein n=1 Tax=Aquimarina litoralis TaxID=584605 RepID=UPI001C57F39E|nr:hypothetical protein [Aquimarina litoralis]MBW1298420.1 hypothetical protein [Aquimarina litoralis]